MTFRPRYLALVLATPVFLLAGCGPSGAPSGGSPTAATVPTTTMLQTSTNPSPEGAPVMLQASVDANTSAPTGSVTFLDGTTPLATVPLTSGTASLTVTTFVAGSTHNISASYPGATGFAPSASATVVLVLNSVAVPTTINAHAAFTFTSPNQTISGFGAAEAFDLTYLDQHPSRAAIYTALFDPTAGLGLTYLRIQNLYSSSSAAGFDPDTPLIVNAANAAHVTPLTLLMSSWSPPAALKSNGSTVGCVTVGTSPTCVGGVGTLAQVSGAYNYAGFATYWLNSLNAYAALGITPSYISIQNEPDFTATYTGCRFNPTEATYNGTNYASYASAFSAVYTKLQTLSTPPKMVGPETLSAAQTFLDTAAQVPTSQISVYAHHLYNVSSTSTNPDANVTPLTTLNTTYPTQTKFMTEYYASPGFNTAWNIHNALTYANDNAYIFWQATWPSAFSNGQATDQQGLIYVDNPSTPSTWNVPVAGWTYNDAYYALKHYSYFVKPTYVRYNATVDNTDERVSVYQSPDKKTTVIVVLNTSSSVTDGLSLNLSNITYANSTVYRSSFATAIATGERFANLGSYNSAGINLPPQSAVTIVLTN
jgi:glucuronoarabinoxylan endo-1,4-beta-xylanase